MTFQVHAVAITNNLQLGEFTVPAKSTHDVTITADEAQMRNARLLGYYSVNGSGIEVLVLDDDEYQRFQNHSTPSQYVYLSKSAPNGTIDVPIPHSGKYHLIFDNSSSDSGVTVKANVAVRGEMVSVEAPAAQRPLAQPPAQKK